MEWVGIREDTVLSCPFMGNTLTCRKRTNSNPVSFRCFCWWCLSALSPRCLLNFRFKCGACSSAHSSNVWGNRKSHWHSAVCIPLFRRRLSEQCRRQSQWYCGWFWIHCSSKHFERMTRKAMDVCLLVLKLSNKSRFDSYSVRNIDHIPYYFSGLSRAHFFRQPFSK